jgi:hypothetical protein
MRRGAERAFDGERAVAFRAGRALDCGGGGLPLILDPLRGLVGIRFPGQRPAARAVGMPRRALVMQRRGQAGGRDRLDQEMPVGDEGLLVDLLGPAMTLVFMAV